MTVSPGKPRITPEYVARHGAPRRPSDLQYHNCVVYSLREGHGKWRFTGPNGEESIQVSGCLKADNGNFLRIAVIKGEGIGLAPVFLVGEDLAAGRLIPLLPDYRPVASDLSVVYPRRRQLSAKVRSFVDFLTQRFTGEWNRIAGALTLRRISWCHTRIDGFSRAVIIWRAVRWLQMG